MNGCAAGFLGVHNIQKIVRHTTNLQSDTNYFRKFSLHADIALARA